MTTKVTIAKLVKTSLARNIPKKVFLSLLLQNLLADPASDNELLEGLVDLPPRDSVKEDTTLVQIELALEFAGSSIENARTFFRLLPRLSVVAQCRYLASIKNQHKTIFKDNVLAEIALVLLPQYTHDVEKLILGATGLLSHEVKSLWSRLMFLWRSVAQCHPIHCNGVLDNTKIIACSQDTGFSVQFVKKTLLLVSARLEHSTARSDQELINGLLKSTESIENTFELNVFSKKYASYLKMKKVAWLTARFKTWSFNEVFLEKYATYFKIPTQNHTEVIVELVGIFFEGLLFAIELAEMPYILFNWKNFIVSRLANALKAFRPLKISGIAEEIGDSLVTATMTYNMPKLTQCKVGGVTSPYDLRKKFLKSCIYLKIITLEQYGKAFSEDARSMSLSLITHEVGQLTQVEQITHEFNSKLAKARMEFTTFEESKLTDYFRSLCDSNFEYLEVKQACLAALVGELVDVSIKERNNEKLARLLLGFLNSISTANFVFFCSSKGPWLILNPLIEYIDSESFSIDDDDSNFQDVYLSFGTILSSVICIVCFFGVDFDRVNIKPSYTVDYINKFFFRLADTLTSAVMDHDEDDKTIVSNYDTLLADWIASLFDVSNDGLSDELLKSVKVKQIYKLMLIIFQQAVSARIANVINSASMNNGIDYLSQNFLAPCSIEIMKWITTRIGATQVHSEAMVEILLKIIESNMGSDQASTIAGPNFAFKMILNVVAPSIFRALKNCKGPNATRLVKFLLTVVDTEYCVASSAHMLDTHDLRVPLRKIKSQLVLLVKKPDAVSLSKCWAHIRACFRNTAPQDLCDAILDEISRCARTPLLAQSEDARLMMDFLISTLVFDSFATSKDILCQVSRMEKKSSSPLSYSKTAAVNRLQFLLSMDSHYSSIFDEGEQAGTPAAPAEIRGMFEAKDDLLGFDTDDLFNDMQQDLFEDAMELDPASATHSYKIRRPAHGPSSASISSTYFAVNMIGSTLNLVILEITRIAAANDYYSGVEDLVKNRVKLELAACLKSL